MTTNNGKRLGQMGWERDLPDIRDYTPEVDAVKKVLTKSQPLRAAIKAAPKSVALTNSVGPEMKELT